MTKDESNMLIWISNHSDFVNGLDSNKVEGSFQYFSDSFAKNNSWFHMFVSDNSVFFVVLLNLHADIEDVVGYLIDGEFLNWISYHIVKFD